MIDTTNCDGVLASSRDRRPGRSPGRRRRSRRQTAPAAAALGALIIAAVSAGGAISAAAAPPPSTTSGALLAGRWSTTDLGAQGGWYGGTSGSNGSGNAYGNGYGDGDAGQSAGTGATNGSVATAAQSTGVALINTVLPYQNAQAAGTGLVLTSSGQVLTNYHVVEGSGTVKVTIPATKRTYNATVVGSDQKDDVALLQLSRASGLRTVKIDQDTTAVGDRVTAVGNAGGTGTLTAAAGSVTSLKATVTTAAEDSIASETLTSMIETDADIVAGDSGGPLLDHQGEVVGIDTAGSSAGDDGFAIPIKEALGIVAQIRSGDTAGGVRIGPAAFLGVELSDSSQDSSGQDSSGSGGSDQGGWGDQSDQGGWGDSSGWGDGNDSTSSGSGDADGATVGDVVAGSAAARAGLAAGDVITAIGSTTIGSAADVSATLAAHKPGDRIDVSWTDTDAATHSASITLGSSPVA